MSSISEIFGITKDREIVPIIDRSRERYDNLLELNNKLLLDIMRLEKAFNLACAQLTGEKFELVNRQIRELLKG